MATVFLTPGARYYAGVDLPWYVPRSVVNQKAQSWGFTLPVWHESTDPLPIDPKTDPNSKSGYSHWVEAVYQGKPQNVDLPATPHFLVVLPPTSQAPSSTAIAPAKKSGPYAPLLIGGAVLLDAAILGFVFKKVKDRKTNTSPSPKGKLMTPATVAVLGAAGLGIYLMTRKPSAEEVKARYQAAMTAPSHDWAYYEREIAWLVKHGELGAANNVQNRVNQLKGQQASQQAAQAAQAAAQAAARAKKG